MKIEFKFKAKDPITGKWIKDGDVWAPYGKDAYYPVLVTNHGVLWTNHIENNDDYVEIHNDGSTKTYYHNWEEDRLAEGLEIKQIEENK